MLTEASQSSERLSDLTGSTEGGNNAALHSAAFQASKIKEVNPNAAVHWLLMLNRLVGAYFAGQGKADNAFSPCSHRLGLLIIYITKLLMYLNQ